MTELRIVADNTVELDIYNFQDIAACARRFADKVEAERAELGRVIVICQWPGGVGVDVWGDNTSSGYELVGLLEAAKLRAHDANLIDDD